MRARPSWEHAAIRGGARGGLLALTLWSMGCGDNVRPKGGDATPAADAAPVDAPAAAIECPGTRGAKVELRQITQINGSLVLVTSPPGDDRLFIVAQDGQLWIFEDGALRATPFLDLGVDAGGPVVSGVERGLLGLAFHPQYAQNRTFYVFYTTLTTNVLARYTTRLDDPDRADPASGTVLLSIDDPYANHNGGMIEFGRDGLLYIGTGDGGGGNDPLGSGQSPTALLGKFLRLDVDHPAQGRPYGIPPGNPFADGVGGAPEIFMLGVRNPWRWSFDDNGDLYIGDVGQDQIEELQIIPADTGAGRNLGWSMYEGTRCNREPPSACDPTGMTFPQVTKTHGVAGDNWCSIIGGAVYRGQCFPDLVGKYFFTDLCYSGLRSLSYREGAVANETAELEGGMPSSPTSLHQAHGGELFLTNYQGAVYHLRAGE